MQRPDDELPFDFFAGELELAAGDHGLAVVASVADATSGPQLVFLRTDLRERAVAPPVPLDPTCAESLVCWTSPFGVFRTADAFLALCFAALDPVGPSPTTELRMVRLIPAP